jgi:predicted transposase/invertase (TIGR01784 family)
MAKRGIKPKEVQVDEAQGRTPETSTEAKAGRGELSRLLSLKNDIVFKMIFGNHRHIGTIRAFLMTVLDIPAEEYEDLEIIDPHLERDSPVDKLGILDVRVQLKNKKLISVEIQIRKTPYMAERIAFSTGRNLARQIGPGQSYAKIERVVTIVIADYDMIPGSDAYHHVFRLYDKDNGILLTNVMEIHTLEWRKLPETAGSDEKEDELLYWLRLIRSEREEEIEMLATKTEEMRMAVGRLKRLSEDEQTRMISEARELFLMDEDARREAAVAEGEARGEARGKAEGRAEGKAEGRAEGKAEGRAEGEARGKFDVARKMLSRKMSISDIADITGLNERDILSLQ